MVHKLHVHYYCDSMRCPPAPGRDTVTSYHIALSPIDYFHLQLDKYSDKAFSVPPIQLIEEEFPCLPLYLADAIQRLTAPVDMCNLN